MNKYHVVIPRLPELALRFVPAYEKLACEKLAYEKLACEKLAYEKLAYEKLA